MSITPDFITVNSSPYDWLLYEFSGLWQGDGSIYDPCPFSWRVPHQHEWANEYQKWISNDHIGAFESHLKLPAAGLRDTKGIIRPTHDYETVGSVWGHYWSILTFMNQAMKFYFTNIPWADTQRTSCNWVKCSLYKGLRTN